jgi:S-adenosylmethionine hydrolase
MKRLSILLVVIIILVSFTACDSNVVKGTIIQKSDNGYAVLDIMPQKLFEIAEVGESVVVIIGDFQMEMSLVDDLTEEDGKLQLYYNSEEHSLNIVSYNQNFCEIYNIPVNSKVKIQKH